MKAQLTLSSATQKVAIMLAFLPLLTMVYPETVAAAYTAQTSGDKALVFTVNSKQTENPTIQTQTPEVTQNQTVVQPETIPVKQPVMQAKVVSVAKAEPAPVGKNYSKEEVQALIVHYSAVYGIDPKTPMCIAFRESGYNQFSKNSRSTASGVFQYLKGTWKGTDEGKAGMSVFDADANVKAAVKYMAIHKSTQPWEVRSMCPKVVFVK